LPVGPAHAGQTRAYGLPEHEQVPALLGVVNLVIAAILTPPDVVSQMLMAIPCSFSMELSVLIACIGIAGTRNAWRR